MAQDVINNDLYINGNLSSKTFTAPAGSILAASIVGAAGVEATKVVHRHACYHTQADGTAVVAATELIHVARASGTLIAFEAIVATIATGADRTVTVDLKKSTGAAAFATVLSATIGFTNASVARTIVSGTISGTTFVDGDILQIVVTVAGAAGNQAQGLLVTLTFEENPQ